MQIGAQLHNNSTTWQDITAVARTMDAGRWSSLWVYDHFFPPVANLENRIPTFEAYALLAGLAATTERVRLGTLVSGNTYRNPALVAKMIATMDDMSGGRMNVGIGAAWFEREHTAFGWQFPSLRERLDRLDEAVQVIRLLFDTEGPVSFEGRYYSLDDTPFEPKCIQQPHAPIMVGGGGEKRTLRTCARYGDIMNVDGPPDFVRRKIEVLERHCADIGRDPAEIKKTIQLTCVIQDDPEKAAMWRERYGGNMTPEERERDLAIGPPERIVEVLKRYEEAGVEEAIFARLPNNPRLYERLNDEVLSAFA